MEYLVLGFAALALAGAVSGWYFAWRSGRDANTAAERARIAETRADAERDKTFRAASSESVALSQCKAMEIDLTQTKMTLARERFDKGVLLEKLATMGAPVGDALFDSTMERLHADRDRRETGQRASASPGPVPVPGDPAAAPAVPGKG